MVKYSEKEILTTFSKKNFMKFYNNCFLSEKLINKVKATPYWERFKKNNIDNFKGGCFTFAEFVFYILTGYYHELTETENKKFFSGFKLVKSIKIIDSIIDKLDNENCIQFWLVANKDIKHQYQHFFTFIKGGKKYILFQGYANKYIQKQTFYNKKGTKNMLIDILENITDTYEERKKWEDIDVKLFRKLFYTVPMASRIPPEIKKFQLFYKVIPIKKLNLDFCS